MSEAPEASLDEVRALKNYQETFAVLTKYKYGESEAMFANEWNAAWSECYAVLNRYLTVLERIRWFGKWSKDAADKVDFDDDSFMMEW